MCIQINAKFGMGNFSTSNCKEVNVAVKHQDVIPKPSKHEKLDLHAYIFMQFQSCIKYNNQKEHQAKELRQKSAVHTHKTGQIYCHCPPEPRCHCRAPDWIVTDRVH